MEQRRLLFYRRRSPPASVCRAPAAWPSLQFREKPSRLYSRWAARIPARHLAGSYIACETASKGGQSLLLQPCILPDAGRTMTYYYDKRHLFRMGQRSRAFHGRLTNVPSSRIAAGTYCLLVCYDLRFPVWSRNVSTASTTFLIYVANWPVSRRKVWDILLQARALENISYVCGVNRIGRDGRDIPHSGGSVVHSPKGEVLATVPDNEETTTTASLSLSSLQEFRLKFPAWKDADEFVISSNNSSQ